MTYDEYEKIKNLQDLLEKGALTQEEFDAEKAKVEALFEKQDKKREEFKAEAKKLNEERGKLMEERKVEDEELQAIIGKEKFEKLQSIRTERQARMRERMGNR